MDERQKWRSELQSPNVDERATAAENLCLAGTEASIATVELVRACADEEAVRSWAVAALEETGTPPAESIGQLIQLTSAADPLVAYWAVTLLGRLGSAASAHSSASETALVNVLAHSNHPEVKERAVWALGKIDGKSLEATSALQQAAASNEPRLSRLAKTALEGSPT